MAEWNPNGTPLTGDEHIEKWDGEAQVYQWDDNFGDVGPEVPELERDLFGDPQNRTDRVGIDFSKIESIEVVQEGPEKINALASFKEAGFHPILLENVKKSGYEIPTPIQKFTVPAMMQNFDVIGIAQTGSGKTAAYLMPVLSKLMGKAKKLAAPRPNPSTFLKGRDEVTAEPLVLIIVPTRELAVQIFNEARKLSYRSMLRPCVVYGGTRLDCQIDLLAKGCDILVGTPGRLADFIARPRVLSLRRLRYLVIDEADEMLNADWESELGSILTGAEQDEGTLRYGLFSATFPKAARDLAKEYLSASHVRFRVGRAGSTTENICQLVIEVDRHEKREKLVQVLNERPGVRTLIFCNSRQEVDNLDDYLFNLGLPVTSMHSDRTQMEREAALRAFRSGKAPILVATGIMARGIDVRNIMHVINFDLPSVDHGGIEEYTHRIGRTGRMGHRGVATSFFGERDEPLGNVLTRTLLETKQEVPSFLQPHVPAAGELKFETESDFDPNDVAQMQDEPQDAGNAWGQSDGQTSATADAATDAWGAANASAGSWGGAAAPEDSWGGANANADQWDGATAKAEPLTAPPAASFAW